MTTGVIFSVQYHHYLPVHDAVHVALAHETQPFLLRAGDWPENYGHGVAQKYADMISSFHL